MVLQNWSEGSEVVGIFDPTMDGCEFETIVPFFYQQKDLESLIQASTHFLVCIGGSNGFARYEIARELKARGLSPVNLVSPHAILDEVECYGDGIQLMPGAVVHKFCKIGDHCIFNTNSTVDHECLIGNGVHIMGGASVAGQVTIGNFSTVGTNATILPRVVIGENVMVGAGAVVVNDVQDNTTVIGVPAKPKENTPPKVDLSIFR